MIKTTGKVDLAWYGDDFTGAAAVMEVLAFAGLPAMLFLDIPTPTQLARYPDLRAIGIASTARSKSPAWMDRELPAVFDALAALSPAIAHYKICSTLDSSPHIGSIGRAIEIAANHFVPEVVPVLVAAPQMRRYQVYGHLFAGLGDVVYRLDRHPVMARHPVTPMTESDVARHIAKQSDRLDISLASLEDLASESLVSEPGDQTRIRAVTLDCVDLISEAQVGRFLWHNRTRNPFVVGSQGVEYALVAHWIATGVLTPAEAPRSAGRAKGMVTVSGSVSPTTADQIAWSRDNGFACIPFDATSACADVATLAAEKVRVTKMALTALAQGQDPLIYTAGGPDDPAVARFKQAASGKDIGAINETIGTALGEVLATTLKQGNIRRAVVSGGDTSGYATRQLGIFALSALAPTIPGAALFKAHAVGEMDGLELALKGGQMGSPDYFGWIRDGGGAR